MTRWLVLVGITAGVACAQPAVQPGAPGQPSQILSADVRPTRPPVHAADVAFVQGMIPHHAQALDMTALVAARTAHAGVRTMAGRIEVAQGDEIAWMRRWLTDHAPNAADPHAGHHGHLMPGMLTPDEMAALATASGDAFDRLFLAGMIRHHEGALAMVRDLLATSGAAQDPLVFRFATDIDADQRADIARMRAMLDSLGPAPAPPVPPVPHRH